MLQILSYKPSGGWWCALCNQDKGEEQGEWFCNVTDGEGRTSSFLCDKHKHLSLEEIVSLLNERQNHSNKITFCEGDWKAYDYNLETNWWGEWSVTKCNEEIL